ncbi:MAG: CBS domain-containing protein [Actinobacteria bacterium]|nr:CBS domain-containing protein [Actinomycetota bacterium]
MTTQQIQTIDELTADILQQLASEDLAALATTLAPLPDAELVPVFERLTLRQRAVMFRLLPKESAVAIFDALDPALQGDLLEGLHDAEVARLFAELDPDDRAWLLEEVPAALATRLLRDLPTEERALTAALLGYPQGSAGRRMTPEYVSVREHATVAVALDRVRERLADAETVYTIPVLDNARHVVGIVSLRDLLGADSKLEVAALMQEPHTAKATEQAEDAARRCTDLSLLALPIVDSEERLVGMPGF